MEHDQGPYFLSGSGAERIRGWILSDIDTGAKETVSLYGIWQKNFRAFQAACARLDKMEFANLSTGKLYKKFEDFYQAYIMAGSLGYIADALISQGESDWLQDAVEKELRRHQVTEVVAYRTRQLLSRPVRYNLEDEIKAAVPVLTQPLYQSFTLEAEWNLVRIGAVLEKRTGEKSSWSFFELKSWPDILRMLQDHARSFHWLKNNYFTVENLSAEYFFDELRQKSAELERIGKTFAELIIARERESRDLKKCQSLLVRKFGLDARAKTLLEAAWLFAEWKDRRKQTVLMGMHYFDRFFEASAVHVPYTSRELSFLVFSEFRAVLLEKKDIRGLIAARMQKTFYAITPSGYFITEGKDAERYFRHQNAQSTDKDVSELKGISACRGLANGTVRVVRTKVDREAFRQGEILVTNQTTPEFVPIMKKAAAIVTEQGGITSHAAVISRELGVPCIIG